MKRRFQNIALAVVAVLSTAAARDRSSGYLATVGPPALRFRVISTSVTSLPPLGSGEKPFASLVPSDSAADSEELKTHPAPHKSESSDQNSDPSVDTAAKPEHQPELITGELGGYDLAQDFAITSQMFLRFFAQATNSSPISAVMIPLSFTPAQPVARQSSSVQYTSAKP